MAWDPSVLRKYSTTSHFRLLNQVRNELKSNPLSRNEEGVIHPLLGRGPGVVRGPVVVTRGPNLPAKSVRSGGPNDSSVPEISQGDQSSFRDRLRAIEMR